MDRLNASRSSIQEDQSYTSVLPEPVRVADKEAAAAMGRVNGFSRQSANLTGWPCGLGELRGEKWPHRGARQTPAARLHRISFCFPSRGGGEGDCGLGDGGLSWGRISTLISSATGCL